MRRKDKEITDIKSIEEIINKAKVFRLALALNNTPYVVPLCFGYHANTIYFHSAREGKKIDILKKNNRVCFEFDIETELVESEKGCNWSMKYRSVIGFGRVVFIEKLDEKKEALEIIMENYSKRTFQFPENMANATLVAKIDIEQISGKFSAD